MYILGIHNGHDAAACLFHHHQLIAFCKEERLTRIKNDGGRWDLMAVDEVLSIAGISRQDIDIVTMTRKKLPLQAFRRVPFHKKIRDVARSFNTRPRGLSLEKEMIRRRELDETTFLNLQHIRQALRVRQDTEIRFVNHDLGHILSAFYASTWQHHSLYLSCDGGGDGTQYSAYYFDGKTMECLLGGDHCLFRQPQNPGASIGVAYALTTQYLGFKKNRHEGKVTGLAAFGQPLKAKKLLQEFYINKDGTIGSSFASSLELLTFLRDIYRNLKPEDVAATIQRTTEVLITNWIKILIQRRRIKYIGLSGGVFSNVLLNYKIKQLSGIEEILVFPAMSDEGLVVGNCVEALVSRHGYDKIPRRPFQNLYLGREFTSEALFDAADKHQCIIQPTPFPAQLAASLLAANKIGAIFHGRMEMGPRALGARSILASPADAAINESLNQRLQRTEFMPFAPYIMAEDAAQVFEINESQLNLYRFMTITAIVRESYKRLMPAVVHIDGSARLQVVWREDNPLYYDILRLFKRETDIPCLINTSFNAHEEPIINRPEEAIFALCQHRIDFLVCDAAIIFAPIKKN